MPPSKRSHWPNAIILLVIASAHSVSLYIGSVIVMSNVLMCSRGLIVVEGGFRLLRKRCAASGGGAERSGAPYTTTVL